MDEMTYPAMLLSAYLLDFLLGDPELNLHPIRILGKLINKIEELLRKIIDKPEGEKIAGIFLCAIMVIFIYLTTWCMIRFSYHVHGLVGSCVVILLAYSTLSVKSLSRAAYKIKNSLREEVEERARKYLSHIVGRDTMQLDREEIIRATVESVAENTSDGIIAPLFYLVLGGPPLAMAYKAINTLDSMVGYKNEKYLRLGWASAKLDDLANYLPARLTAILMIVSAFLLKADWKNAYVTMRRDAKMHNSPNSGYPESTVAGALRIRLGGLNYYSGSPVMVPYLGIHNRKFNEQLIGDVVNIMYVSSLIMLLLGVIFLEVVS